MTRQIFSLQVGGPDQERPGATRSDQTIFFGNFHRWFVIFFFWFRVLILLDFRDYNVFVPLLPLTFSQDHPRDVTQGVPLEESSFFEASETFDTYDHVNF